MILIERYSGYRGQPGIWQRAWQGEDWDDDAREIVQMCDRNGDPWRATFNSESVRR